MANSATPTQVALGSGTANLYGSRYQYPTNARPGVVSGGFGAINPTSLGGGGFGNQSLFLLLGLAPLFISLLASLGSMFGGKSKNDICSSGQQKNNCQQCNPQSNQVLNNDNGVSFGGNSYG